MLVVTPLSPAAADYYFRGQGAGRWVGHGSAVLGLAGEVRRRHLGRVLQGCDPADGKFMPARKQARRRAGWDLTLAAPKSLSLLAAMASAGDQLAAAHRAAVDEVVDDLERRLLSVMRSAVPGGLAPTVGAVAASFEHLGNGAGEPHLHSHLLLCNLGRDDGGTWSSLSSTWWTQRRGLGALYQLGVRYHLNALGLELDWRLRGDGLADIAGVPRTAVRSTSGRSRAAAADRGAFRHQADGRISGIRAAGTIRTRGTSPPPPWLERAAAAGLGPAEADRLMDRRQLRPAHRQPAFIDLDRAVTAWLMSQRSSFRRADVLVALAACVPGGLTARQAADWVEQFCRSSLPSPRGSPSIGRWTTALALAADQRLVAQAEARPPATPLVPSRRTGSAVRRLLSGLEPLQVLEAPPGRTNLLAHAEVLAACASGWAQAGLDVAVATSSPQAELRWRILTGIGPYRPSTGADVLIVDHADRRPTAELLAILTRTGGQETILIEGGSAPRLTWMRSDGFAWLGDRLGRVDPGPPPAWTASVRAGPDLDGTRQEPGLRRGATDAAGLLLRRWADEWAGPASPVLVAMGYTEVDALNQAARTLLASRGALTGPGLRCRGKILQAGEQVIALRQLTGGIPQGSTLEVADVNTRQSRLTVRRSGFITTLDRTAAAHLGYRYTVTPALAGHTTGPLLVLGPPSALGPQQGRVLAAAMVAPVREADRVRRRPPPDLGAGLGIR